MNKIFKRLLVFAVLFALTSSNVFAATKTWDFSTSSDYTFDTTKIEVIGGQAQLKATTTPAWYDTSWKYRKKISIDHTKISSDLTDFPVLVNQTSDSDLAAKALTSGNDIFFTSSDGVTKLSHEIETYASTTGALAAWIKVPTVSSSVDTDVYMYYGNAAASAQANANGVWDSNSIVVQHLNATTSPALDSTSNANSGVQSGGVTFSATGKIGNAVSMDGVNDKLSLTSNSGLNATGTLSISAWVNRTASGKMRVVAKTVTTGTTDNPYDFGINTDNTLYLNRADSSVVNFLSSSTTVPTNSWTKIEVIDDTVVKSAFNSVSKLVTLATSTRAWQGVASDGTYIYAIGQNAISQFDMQGNFIKEKNNVYSGFTGGNILGNGTVINGKLYVGAYNANTLGASTNPNYTPLSDLQSKIAVFSLSDFSLIEDFNLGTQVKIAEGVDYHNGYFWVVDGWFDTFVVKKYDTSFNLVSTYSLPVANAFAGELTYQNINWYGNDIFVNWHGSNSFGQTYAYGLDHYSFDGTNFNFVERLRPVTYGAGQGIAIVGNTFYWADRPGNAIYKSTYVGAGNGDDGIDPSHTKFFINGVGELAHVSTGSLTVLSPTSNTSPTVIGTRGDSSSFYKGVIDEVRISNAARSDAWVSASYANENSPSTFYSMGSEQKNYAATNPTVNPTSLNAQAFSSLSGFSAVEVSNGGNIKYQVSNDGGTTWYWYNSGWNTTTSGYSETNASSTINTNIASLPVGSGSYLFKAYLNSDGTQQPQIDSVVLTYSAPLDITAPIISAIASSTSQTSATITWTTDESATSTVNYGLNTSYGTASSSSSLVTSHSISLSGLTASTAYHFQVASADASGNVATSSDYTFTTTAVPDTTPPVISSISSGSLSTSGTTITWTTDEAADSQVNYGTSASYGSQTTLDSTLVTSHSIVISGLSAGTTYHYQVVSKDASGNTATSSDQTFTTSAQPSSGGSSSGSYSGGGSILIQPSVPGCPTGFNCVVNPTPTILPNTFTRDLTIKSTGSDVKVLQQFLIAKGFLASGNDTGYFGPLTQAALAQYQLSMGIKPSVGYFGSLTRAVIAVSQNISPTTPSISTNPTVLPSTFTRDLYFGMSGDDVKLLQKFLNDHQFIVSQTGAGSPGLESNYFGPATRDALIRFQTYNHIVPAVGYFGSLTRQFVNGQ